MASVDLTALNAVAVSESQMAVARDALVALAPDLRWNAAARHAALEAVFAAPLAAAIDARLLALRKWEDLHDPDRCMAQVDLMDAAAIAHLVETDHGVGFDDVAFGELVAFFADLPW